MRVFELRAVHVIPKLSNASPAPLLVYSLVKLASPWKVLPLGVHGSFTTCIGLSVTSDPNRSSVSFFLTYRWSVWISWWIVPVWKAAWGHPEFKHTLWEPKMIKYSKKRPTDWMTEPFPRLPVWWQEWLSSLAFNPMSVSGVKIAHSLKWSQPTRPGVRREFISEAVTDKDFSIFYKQQKPVCVFMCVCIF